MKSTDVRPIYPTEEEDAAITAAAEADPDTWILSDEELARMRPAAEVHPELVAAHMNGTLRISWETLADTRDPKKKVTLSLDAGLVTYFTQTGDGWEQRLNDMLRAVAFGERDKLVACTGDVYSCPCSQR